MGMEGSGRMLGARQGGSREMPLPGVNVAMGAGEARLGRAAGASRCGLGQKTMSKLSGIPPDGIGAVSGWHLGDMGVVLGWPWGILSSARAVGMVPAAAASRASLANPPGLGVGSTPT